MNLIKIDNNIIINDCYNSSFESITAGLEFLHKVRKDKVLIIGDVLELGKHSKKIHKKINKKVKEFRFNNVLTVGEYSKNINGINFNNSEELIEYLKENPINNSYIYIKGSRRMYLDKIVDYFIQK